MTIVLAVAFGVTVQALSPSPSVHPAQMAELRSYARNSYYKYYCLAVNPGRLEGPINPAKKLEEPASLKRWLDSNRLRLDPPAELLAELEKTSQRLVSYSECEQDSNLDIRHRATKEPSLLVAIGAVEVLSPDRVRFMVSTMSGHYAAKEELVEYKRTANGWGQVSRKILVQA